jgi:hypothetical protein
MLSVVSDYIVQRELEILLCHMSQDFLRGGIYLEDPSDLFMTYKARWPEEPVESMAWLKNRIGCEGYYRMHFAVYLDLHQI